MSLVCKSPPLGIPHLNMKENDDVNQLFSRLDVDEMRSLRREYQLVIDSARSDLHQLVSQKYRDLVRIAEDIRHVHGISVDIDTSVASLSYRPASFVPFSTIHPQTTFQSHVRNATKSEVLSDSKMTVLNCIFMTKLTKLDLLIAATKRGHRPCPFEHTSHLVYYAQVYHTVESVFAECLLKDKHAMARYNRLKLRFIAYIELQIALYNATVLHARTPVNDMFSPKDVFSINDFSKDEALAFENVSSDDEDEYGPATIHQALSHENLSEYMQDYSLHSRLGRYNTNVVPIMNYLVVYIMLNHTVVGMSTLAAVAERFLDIRHAHARKLLSTVIETISHTNLDFYALFKYVENTFQFVESFFGTANDHFLHLLQTYTAPWKPSEILGLHSWLPDDPLVFGTDIYCISLPRLVVDALYAAMHVFFRDTMLCLNQLLECSGATEPLTMLSHLITVFSNTIKALMRMRLILSSRGILSMLLQYISQHAECENFLVQHLMAMAKQSELAFSRHVDFLIGDEESSVRSTIMHHCLGDQYVNRSDYRSFSLETTRLVDKDLVAYISSVTSAANRETSTNVSRQIHSWFRQSHKAMGLVSANQDTPGDSRLSSLYSLLADPSLVPCGPFSNEMLQSVFAKVKQKMELEKDTAIAALVHQIDTQFAEGGKCSIRVQFYLLQVIIVLDGQLRSFDDTDSLHLKTLYRLAKEIYTSIVQYTFGNAFQLPFAAHVERAISCDNAINPSMRPSLFISSLIHRLSRAFVAGIDEKVTNEYGEIFEYEPFVPIFAAVKGVQINQLIEQGISKSINAKNPEFAGVSLFADLVYLGMFGNEAMSLNSAQLLWRRLMCKGSNMESNLVERVFSGVSTFYQSTRLGCFPVLDIEC